MLLATAAASLTVPPALSRAHAATPANTIVMAKEIGDIISFDPAQSYEFTDTEVDANIYRKLIAPDLGKLKVIARRNHFQNTALTDEVEQAAEELDTAKRLARYHQIQQQSWHDSPIVFMLQQNVVAVVRKNVTGFQLGAQSDFVRYGKTRKA